ncbi:TPA: M48 family metallopeptidase [Klebsiella aerogenes]
MKIRSTLLAFGIAATLTGCQNMDSNALLSSGAEAFQAYSLSDEQVKTLSDQACKEMDAKATISPASSEYSKRLSKIAAALGDNINGQPVNYKVYETKDVNAFAMANGCIRVYSGLMNLMNLMNDNEVEAVIGHEMGHVALGHVKKGMQVALGTNAVRAAAASAGGIVGSLSQSQLGDLGEKLVNSQFSQRQESEADDYSYDLLRKRGINPSGLATSFEKLAKLEAGRQSSMFDDHPASEARAQHIRDRMKADGIK